jgi:hypothetical protein
MSARADTNCHAIFNFVSATGTHLAKIGATRRVVPTCRDMSATFPANITHFGSDKRTSRKMWQKTPYGLSLPYVLNSMSHDAYEFLRRNLHFTDNYKQQPEGSEGYDQHCKG